MHARAAGRRPLARVAGPHSSAAHGTARSPRAIGWIAPDAHPSSLGVLLSSRSRLVARTPGYVGEFEIVDDHRASKIVVELTGRINKCGVISPRFDLQLKDIEQWINNLLPSRQFGHIVLSTTYGIMDHEEARRKRTGGKILGFFY